VGGVDAEMEALVLAMEAPYIFLVTRLVDTQPMLVRRVFARQAQLQMKGVSDDARAAIAADVSTRTPSSFVRDGRLNIGYISGLPAGHVTYDLVGSMLRFHTDRHLKVYWCTAAAEPAPVREGNSLQGGLKVPHEYVIELSRMTPTQAAARLREYNIGILIDLDGWIGDEPPRVLMGSLPAPVRSQWLGWASTTADPSVHHMVTDALVTPCEQHTLYRERLLLLPRSYQLNDHAQIYAHLLRPEPPAGPDSSAVSSANGSADGSRGMPKIQSASRRRELTIANFNQLMKISPDVFAVWTGAMRRVSGVRLLLLTGVTSVHVAYPSAARNLRAEIASHGVRIVRLQHAGVMKKPSHLMRAAGCHVGVDTLSYNSHTTGADSLWAGLPLLTLPGRAFSARVGFSLVSSSGMPSLGIASLKAYEDALTALVSSSREAHGAAALERRIERDRQQQRHDEQKDKQKQKPTRSQKQQLTASPAAALPPSPRPTFGTFRMGWDTSQLGTDYLEGPRPWTTSGLRSSMSIWE
jgi:predicted O-linked N-acetylglucosamine transferase (SPINDLY family)